MITMSDVLLDNKRKRKENSIYDVFPRETKEREAEYKKQLRIPYIETRRA